MKHIMKIILLIMMVVAGPGLRAMDVEFPLIQSMSYFPYNDHFTRDAQTLSLTLNLAHSNIFIADSGSTTALDMAMLSNTITLRYGFKEHITFELYCRTQLAFGGILDEFTDKFHKAFGFSRNGRDEVPFGLVNYKYGDQFAYTKATLAQSPLVLAVLGNFYKTDTVYLNGRAAVGVPLLSKTGFSGKPFFTVGLIYGYKRGKVSWHFANHVSVAKNPRWQAEEDLKNVLLHSELRGDYKRVFGGLVYRSSPFKTGDLSNAAIQAYIGVKIGKIFEFSLHEEFPPMDTTPDFTFMLKVNLMNWARWAKD
ncbi:MAG: DUF3187 family protein [bacterium]|nr:DUF3187 family protein [bacterium]